MNRAFRISILIALVLLLAAPQVSLARKKLVDAEGNPLALKMIGRSYEDLTEVFGKPDRTLFDAEDRICSFFAKGFIAFVHREYDEVDRVVLTTFADGQRFEGRFQGVRLGDHYLSCQGRWGFPESKDEQPDQWYDVYRWKVEGYPVEVQIWNRTADDPNFGYVKNLTVKRIEVRRKRERWE
ncbi:MAG: hypothetical protein P9M14_02120 [Candidatus Alcyoniella australis]|nr:hypothetical protein [Candidatus Alcyoniella australis]